MPDPDVMAVLGSVPEFAERYLDLVEAADGDPGTVAAFAELAEFTAALVDDLSRHGDVLARIVGALEDVASTSPDAEEHVGFAFLDTLSPDELGALRPWLGPQVGGLADRLEADLGAVAGAGPGREVETRPDGGPDSG